METVYTVLESAGSVEVCVHLVVPQFDILDETIIVEIYDNESSIYIPDNATLASETKL